MILYGTTTQMPLKLPSNSNRSMTRNAVKQAYNQYVKDDVKLDETSNENVYNHNSKNDSENATKSKFQQLLQALVSFLEFLVLWIYNFFGIGLHVCLAIGFLAIVAVTILGSFHDRYWVTILNRARRTDANLRTEITYYQRQCDVTDVTTSTSHHIHFGDVDDKASEMFIDVEKIMNEESDLDDSNQEDTIIHEQGFPTRYQEEWKPPRRRRRFAPKYQAWESPELKPIPKKVAEKAGKQGVDAMMKHGSVMIPQILSDATISELRKFVDKKNELVLGTPDEYPMTAAHNRISYGIESTEDPAVVRALKEIHDHAVFASLIQNLVGDENPALSEITAITSWAGAEHQSWHPDVKPHGNGVMFGRTYSHSYSLFLPLQDTTGRMGATELCPGTHMCATESLSTVCDSNKIGLHEVRKARPRNQYSPDLEGELKYQDDLRKEGLWRAGDGALLNQQGWHRGTAHEDENEDDRIVFIVSFLKRPHPDDPRQLARGTYFHQKWLNWGSTWEDMTDTMANLQRPWNILRCLHLYKPSDRSWGYDLFTATTLRVANSQMGGEPEDLDNIINNVMDPLGFPEWLQGSIDYEDEYAWQIYMSQTLKKTFQFLGHVNRYGHLGLVAFLAIAAGLGHLYNKLLAKVSGNSSSQHSVVVPVLKTGVKRLILTHGTILALAFYFWRVVICSSQWAIDIDSGKTLMRPFPTNPVYRYYDPGVLGSKTTLPRRSDVLIGTRLSTKAIGAYKTWIEYHPGNRVFDQFVERYGGTKGFYQSLLPQHGDNQTTSELPSGLSDRLVDSAFDMITKHHGGGRFVMQDYRSGNWMVLSEAESRDYIQRSLMIGNKDSNTMAAIQDEIDMLLDRQRFGVPRNALSMSWICQLFLHDLSKQFLSTKFERSIRKTRKPATAKDVRTRASALSPSLSIALPKSGYRLPKWGPLGPTVSGAKDKDGNWRFLMDQTSSPFRPGMEVFVMTPNEEGGIDPLAGTIVSMSSKDRFTDGRSRFYISLEEEGVELLESFAVNKVPREKIRTRSPITSGMRIMAQVRAGGDFFDGTAHLVQADGSMDIVFDDGDVELGMEYSSYIELLEDYTYL